MKLDNEVIVRIEQLALFPYDLIISILQQYYQADIVWCQEEPKNMGAYGYIKPRLETAMRDISDNEHVQIQTVNDGQERYRMKPVQYVGRSPLAASASGGMREHLDDQKRIIVNALQL